MPEDGSGDRNGLKHRLGASVHLLLFGSEDGRVRASWRIVIAIGLTFVGAIAGSLAVQRVAPPALFSPLLAHSFAVVGVLVAVGLMSRYIDHRPVSEYGFTVSFSWLIDTIVGVGIGVTIVALAFGLNYQRGAMRIVDTLSPASVTSIVSGVGVVVVGWVLVSVWEETLFRGLFLKNAAEGLFARGAAPLTAAIGAWLSSSLVYGFLHGPLGSNPEGVSLTYALIMTSVMGGLFGLAYLLSDELALPIGLHTGINFAEHNLFLGPPDGVAPALVRVEHAVTGAHVQFQSISPSIVIPVFICGYLLIFGWVYVRGGELAIKRRSIAGTTPRNE